MQSTTRWCLNEGSMSSSTLRSEWDHYTRRQKSYASDLRQSGANWREVRFSLPSALPRQETIIGCMHSGILRSGR
jgi:hypothetical protein